MSTYNSTWIERNAYLRPKPGTNPGDHHYEGFYRPVIVCLCGSTRFKQQFIDANFVLTRAGEIVLSVGWFSHADGEVWAPTEDDKKGFDELHKRKIDLADAIMVLNVGGYVGESTRSEVLYARTCHKTIRWLEPDNVPDDLKETN